MEVDSRRSRVSIAGSGDGKVPVRLDDYRSSVAQLPDRYSIKEDEDGRYLVCGEMPEVKVRMQRDFSVTAGAARKYPPGTIFLDGAAQSEPFLDLERKVYNLDHHEGCERRFTMSACEQAMVLVLRGLDLRERPWTIYANEPDLDTVMAIWVLLNSVHLQNREEESIKASVLPLVRLEGLIDVQGLEYLELSGFPKEHLEETFRQLEWLRSAGAVMEAEEDHVDVLAGTMAQLRLIDQLVYPRGFIEELPGVEELAREELTEDRIVVVCRSEDGIYEVEKSLKRLYGKRLGLIVLEKEPRTYTLRQVDSFLPVTLEAAYRRLNLVDPAVKRTKSANRWGGSGEIGGSPRSSGTDLTPAQIALACSHAYRRPSLASRLGSIGLAFLVSAAAMAAGWFMESLGAAFPAWSRTHWQGSPLAFAGGSLAVALIAMGWLARAQRRRLFGFQLPVGVGWLWLVPVAIGGALMGGAWAPPLAWREGVAPTGVDLAAMLAFPLAAELTFRGIAHGLLLGSFSAQRSLGRWFLSWPVALSAIFYALWTIPLWHPPLGSAGLIWPSLPPWVAVAGALLFGAALGICRERSGSLLAPLAVHYLGLATAVALMAAGLG